jgi:hypothetical protein
LILHNIHYAKYRLDYVGIETGIVSHFTFWKLSETPLSGGKHLIHSPSGVTRSQSVSKWDWKTLLKFPAKPHGLRLPADSNPEKILFHLALEHLQTRQTRAAIGSAAIFWTRSQEKLFQLCHIGGNCHG